MLFRSFSGILASSLYAATFRLSGAWFDVGRVDSLFLFLLLLAIYIIRFHQTYSAYLLAGICLACSFLAKQTVLPISMGLLIYCFIIDYRLAIVLAATELGLIGTSTMILNRIHDGWYNYYVFLYDSFLPIPGQYGVEDSMFLGFWTIDIWPLAVAFILAVYFLITERIKKSFKIDYPRSRVARNSFD